VMFGLWHITPTLATLRINAPDAGPLATVLVVTAGVAVTALGGGVFSLLRLRSGSLAAPFIAHIATNVFGTLSAVTALRRAAGRAADGSRGERASRHPPRRSEATATGANSGASGCPAARGRQRKRPPGPRRTRLW
jgi:hypothetical protein